MSELDRARQLIRRICGPTPTARARAELLREAGVELNARQLEVLLARGHGGEEARTILLAGGERAGKSETSAAYAFSLFPWSELIWVLGPDYELARREFEYLHRNASAIGAVESASMPHGQGPWHMRLRGGCLVETKSSFDTEKLAGKAPDVVLLVEAAQQPYSALLRARSRVAEKRGRLLVSGTFESSAGWYAETWQAWQQPNEFGGVSFSLPSWTNTAVYPGGRRDEEILAMEKALGPQVFSERIAGVPMPPRGLVFPEFSQDLHVSDARIGQAKALLKEARGGLEVGLWIDRGWAGAYAVMFVAVIAERVYVLDEIYAQHKVNEEIVRLAQANPLWRHVTHVVMDIAGKGHGNAERAPAEVWRLMTRLPIRMNPVGILDGINRTRTFLSVDAEGDPRLTVSSSARGLIFEMTQGYQYDTDSLTGEVRNEKPRDRHNHSAKALAYGLVERFGLADIKRTRGPIGRYVPAWERHTRVTSAADRKQRAIREMGLGT